MRRFVLFRKHDVSGVSGTGVVAEGVEFSTGKIVLNWSTNNRPQSVVVYDAIEEAIEIHGHGGATEIKWIDEQKE